MAAATGLTREQLDRVLFMDEFNQAPLEERQKALEELDPSFQSLPPQQKQAILNRYNQEWSRGRQGGPKQPAAAPPGAPAGPPVSAEAYQQSQREQQEAFGQSQMLAPPLTAPAPQTQPREVSTYEALTADRKPAPPKQPESSAKLPLPAATQATALQPQTTSLIPPEEGAFRSWYKNFSKVTGHAQDPDAPGEFYDFRGYWKAQGRNLNIAPDMPLSPAFMRPGHPAYNPQTSIYQAPMTVGDPTLALRGQPLGMSASVPAPPLPQETKQGQAPPPSAMDIVTQAANMPGPAAIASVARSVLGQPPAPEGAPQGLRDLYDQTRDALTPHAKELMVKMVGPNAAQQLEHYFPVPATLAHFLDASVQLAASGVDFAMTPIGIALAGVGTAFPAARTAIQAGIGAHMAQGAGEAIQTAAEQPSPKTIGSAAAQTVGAALPMLPAIRNMNPARWLREHNATAERLFKEEMGDAATAQDRLARQELSRQYWSDLFKEPIPVEMELGIGERGPIESQSQAKQAGRQGRLRAEPTNRERAEIRFAGAGADGRPFFQIVDAEGKPRFAGTAGTIQDILRRSNAVGLGEAPNRPIGPLRQFGARAQAAVEQAAPSFIEGVESPKLNLPETIQTPSGEFHVFVEETPGKHVFVDGRQGAAADVVVADSQGTPVFTGTVPEFKDWFQSVGGTIPGQTEPSPGPAAPIPAQQEPKQEEPSDQENIPGVSGEVGVGQKPVQTEPVQTGSGEKTPAGGILQTPEEEVTHTFQTSQGSTYSVFPDGTTIRVKTQHQGHDPKDVGEKDRSGLTVYVNPDQAREVGMWNTSSAEGKRIVVRGDNLILTSINPKTGQRGRDGMILIQSHTPRTGLNPVELFDPSSSITDAWRGNHPGNTITSMSKTPADTPDEDQPDAETQPAPASQPEIQAGSRYEGDENAEALLEGSKVELDAHAYDFMNTHQSVGWVGVDPRGTPKEKEKAIDRLNKEIGRTHQSYVDKLAEIADAFGQETADKFHQEHQENAKRRTQELGEFVQDTLGEIKELQDPTVTPSLRNEEGPRLEQNLAQGKASLYQHLRAVQTLFGKEAADAMRAELPPEVQAVLPKPLPMLAQPKPTTPAKPTERKPTDEKESVSEPAGDDKSKGADQAGTGQPASPGEDAQDQQEGLLGKHEKHFPDKGQVVRYQGKDYTVIEHTAKMIPTRSGVVATLGHVTLRDPEGTEIQLSGPDFHAFTEPVKTPPAEPAKPTKTPAGHPAIRQPEATEPTKTEGAPSPERHIIEEVKKALDAKQKIEWRAFEKLAETAYGGSRAAGKFQLKQAYDAMEAGVNEFLRSHAKRLLAASPKDALAELREMMDLLPTQTTRSHAQEQLQQFSTPPTLSWLVNKLADVNKDDVVLEPSAGTGSLTAMIRDRAKEVHVNEIDAGRDRLLGEQDYRNRSTVDAEKLDSLLHAEGNKTKPTVIVMNPPFSATGGRVVNNSNRFGYRHVLSALDRLAPGGRLVAILGEGATPTAPNAKWFYDQLNQKYDLKASIGIDGSEYRKYGTTFGNRILVIDKKAPTGKPPVVGEFTNIEDAYAALEQGNTTRELEVRPEPDSGKKGGVDNGSGGPVAGVRGERPSEGEGTPGVRGGSGTTGGRVSTGGTPSGTGRGAAGGVSEGGGNQPAAEKPGESGTVQPVSPAGRVPESNIDSTLATNSEPQPHDQVVNSPPASPDGIESPATPPSHKIETQERREEVAGTSAFVPYHSVIKGKEHLGDLVETRVMASTDAPEIDYTPDLPEDIDISSAQMESPVRAGMIHEKFNALGERLGYMLGDGTGAGKGRQLAAILWDNWRRGRRRQVWLSVKQDLFEAAAEDFIDIGASEIARKDKGSIKGALKKWHNWGELDQDAVVFGTYHLLIAEEKKQGGKTRFDQLIEFLDPKKNGGDGSVIVLDEAHKAKNAMKGEEGSKTGRLIVELQAKLPKARVVYSTATSATDIENLGYLSRMGLWGPGTAFPSFESFVGAMGGSGVAGMELIARELKAAGKYVSRSISYDGVAFDEKAHNINDDQREAYDLSVAAWQKVMRAAENQAVENAGGNHRAKKRAASNFWGGHQRFFRSLLTAFKVPTVGRLIEEELAKDRSVVVSLILTGETATKRAAAAAAAAGESPDELDVSPKEILIQAIKAGYPIYEQEEVAAAGGGTKIQYVTKDGKKVIKQAAVEARDRLIEEISNALKLPESPLDQLVNRFGRDKVAELTGRKKVWKDGKLVSRAPKGVALDNINAYEMQQFQDGNKRIAIISKAADTGISLHSSLKRKNQQPRTMIAMELSWSADDQMQSFGRVHRSAQQHPPYYMVVSTDAGGERRFSSTIARRLESLGALSKGSRQASGGAAVLAKYNVETPQGEAAAQQFYNSLIGGTAIPNSNLAPDEVLVQMGVVDRNEYGALSTMKQDLKTDVRILLNRILNLRLGDQNAVYDYFTDIYDLVMQDAEAKGQLDHGVSTIHGDEIRQVSKKEIGSDPNSGAKTYRTVIAVDRKNKPLSYEDAKANVEKQRGRFVVSPEGRYFLALRTGNLTNTTTGSTQTAYRVISPEHWDSSASLDMNRMYPRKQESEVRQQYTFVGEREEEEWRRAVREHTEAENTYKRIKDDENYQKRYPEYIKNTLETVKRLDAKRDQLHKAYRAAPEKIEEGWNNQVAAAKSVRTDTHNLITGAVMHIWDQIGSGMNLDIRQAYPKGQPSTVGILVNEPQAARIEEALTGTRAEMSPAGVMTAVMESGDSILLRNNLRLMRGTLGGNRILQIHGADTDRHIADRLRQLGVKSEKVGSNWRFYIPSDPETAVPILTEVLKNYPPSAFSGIREDADGKYGFKNAPIAAAMQGRRLEVPEPLESNEYTQEDLAERTRSRGFPASRNLPPVVAVNQYGTRLIAALLNAPFDRVLGVTIWPSQLEKIKNALKDLDNREAAKLRSEIDRVEKKQEPVIFVDGGANRSTGDIMRTLREEATHQEQYEHGLFEEDDWETAGIRAHPAFKVAAAALNRHGYDVRNKNLTVLEVAAKITAGRLEELGLTHEQALSLLGAYRDAIRAQFKDSRDEQVIKWLHRDLRDALVRQGRSLHPWHRGPFVLEGAEEPSDDVDAGDGGEVQPPGQPGGSGSGGGGRSGPVTPGTSGDFEFSNEEIERRFSDAEYPADASIREKTRSLISQGKQWASELNRILPHIPKTPHYAPFTQRFLRMRRAPGIATERAHRMVRELTRGMTRQDYDLYRRAVIMDDIRAHRVRAAEEAGIDDVNNFDAPMPFGFTPQEFDEEYRRLHKIIDDNKLVRDRLRERRLGWEPVIEGYKAAARRAGMDVDDRFTNASYFRHRVFEHMAANETGIFSRKVTTPAGRSFLKRRGFNALDYSTDYLATEYEVLSQLERDRQVLDFIGWVKNDSGLNAMDTFKAAARLQNQQNAISTIEKMLGELPPDVDRGEAAAKQFRIQFNRPIAKAMNKLARLAKWGELPEGDKGQWRNFLDRLAQQATKEEEGEIGEPGSRQVTVPETMAYANWLQKQNAPDELQFAGLALLGAVQKKKAGMKELLAKEYIDPEDADDLVDTFGKDTHAKYQPRNGSRYYWADTIADNLAQKLYSGAVEELGIKAEDLKKVRVPGREYTPFILPKEVAQQMEELYPERKEGPLAAAGRLHGAALRKWKEFTLGTVINPERFLRVQLRNLSGDAEAVFVGNPSTFKQVPQATQDLWNYYRHGHVAPELEDWMDRGGMFSMERRVEPNDLRHLDDFHKLYPQPERTTGLPMVRRWSKKVWNSANVTATFRESILRYAAYLDYLYQIRKSKTKTPNNYGASDPAMVDQLESPEDKAYKLSNDLLGAYDETSVAGQALARNVLPFWRFQELNLRRFKRFIQNAARDEQLAQAIGRKILAKAAIRAPYLAYRVGMLFLKMLGVYAAIQAFNELFHKEEEKQLPDYAKNSPHITFGRDSKGNILFFPRIGNLPDVLEWMGPENATEQTKKVLSGEMSVPEYAKEVAMGGPVSKLYSSLSPMIKTPMEMWNRKNYFPNIQKPRPILDRGLKLAEDLSMDYPYRAVVGKGVPPMVRPPVVYTADPRKNAYWDIMAKKWEFLGRSGGSYGEMTPKAEAFYNFKDALGKQDPQAAAHWKKIYAERGGDKKDYERRIDNAAPLAGLSAQKRDEFLRSLTEEEREELARAEIYYRQTFLQAAPDVPLPIATPSKRRPVRRY